jgi:hypothetical protein
MANVTMAEANLIFETGTFAHLSQFESFLRQSLTQVGMSLELVSSTGKKTYYISSGENQSSLHKTLSNQLQTKTKGKE